MVDIGRQLPATSASAWATYLSGAEGPGFVVLALAEHEARASLVRHLVETGSIPNTIEAGRPVATAPAESGVLW